MNYKVKDEDRIKRTGRKPVGYSITKDKKKICDDEIKDFIIESINGDAQYYGYRKITHYLRRTYNLIINFKKVYRLRKELNILKDQRHILKLKEYWLLIGLLLLQIRYGKLI